MWNRAIRYQRPTPVITVSVVRVGTSCRFTVVATMRTHELFAALPDNGAVSPYRICRRYRICPLPWMRLKKFATN
ncbi:MAG: hypothetical protein QOJ99_2939 [Bryobacterales bacterium]|jgi:hypothetical protein|nr:hypothetical protein [Bryobacterales bacterium]